MRGTSRRERPANRGEDLRSALRSSLPCEAARLLLGCTIEHGPVRLRIVETEAYGGPPDGPWPDPAAHSYRGPTARNQVMFGPPGHLYIYRIYGMHQCLNITYGPAGRAGGVLLRAGEILGGISAARARRGMDRAAHQLARGPANLAASLGIPWELRGSDVLAAGAPVRLGHRADDHEEPIRAGPRVGVRFAADRPWRFWLHGHPAVSAYRRHPAATDAAGRVGLGH
ncbi:DNA-3-methyladenine glycosylase [Lolliginicoccus suaedae]|uniref:DNA-3-methyladenine glycosylase n=1 Tax=Lolliginicoccus suaedae TaxID=2605429 RepID=UPI0011ED2394|nr:DNA-3-methyladenine glycosylase [Lolliginicoccus suaedae]